MSWGQRRARFAFCCALLVAALVITGRAAPAFAQSTDPSIYEYINSHVDPTTGTLSPEAMTLPDEPAARRFGRLRWVSGALEGLGTRHMQWDGSEKASQATRLLELIAAGNSSVEPALYELLRTDDVVTFYSDALDLASARIRDAEPTLHDLARRLATTAHDRGPVKFAIAMLGSIGDERDLGIVQTLALHDEFGLYAAEAIGEIAPNRQAALYDMARKVSGWGRIEAVTQMTATHDPALRYWLLTQGFRNTVTPQYLAYQCATIADLAGALSDSPPEPKVDSALLVGAADLIQTLIKPGPARGFDNYSDAPQVAESFLRLIQKRRDSVSFFLAANALRDYVAARMANASAQSGNAAEPAVAWEPGQLSEVATLAANIAGDSRWRRNVISAIGDDRTDLDQAEVAAQKLHIDTFDLHLHSLMRNPANPRRWVLAFAATDPEHVGRLVEVAQRSFGTRFADSRTHNDASSYRDPGAVVTDPAELRTAATLEAVLQGIASYPGSGLSLVEASLADVDDRVRRAAVETLVHWGGAYLRNASVRTALNDAAREEADEALRARMVALLNLATLP